MKRIIAYKKYFPDFYESLSNIEKQKVDKALILMMGEDKIPRHYIKPLEDAIYELRISVPSKEIRILFIYDDGNLVILFNSFYKKTQKTPRAQIEKAKQLKKQYYDEKNQR